ncbi:MAG: secretin N-terminal domain-containing protein [Coraliomargaritaceae bacterium]
MKRLSITTFLSCLLFCGTSLLWSQETVPQEGTLPQNNFVPLEPDALEPEEIVDELILVDMPANEVIDLLETLTGKIILRRQDITAKINFNSRGPLTESEAVLALESILSLNAVMLTDLGGRFMKAVPATNVNTHVPEMIVGSTLTLTPSQQIYAKIFTLEYLFATDASPRIIQPLLSQNSGLVIFEKSNAVLVTDALLNLQRIEQILKEADQPQAVRESIEFVKLDFVQAKEMQEQLENLIRGPLKNYLEGNTSVTADERTNQLIIVTHTPNLQILMDVIENVDIDSAPLTSSEVFPLRQAKAEEVVPIIEKIITGQEEGREEDSKVARENNAATPTNQPAKPTIPGIPVTPTVTAGVGTADSSSTLQFSNFVGLSADERTNSIVAYGTHSDLRTLKELIDKIDIPLPQVRIEAIITEVSLDANQASGFSKFNLEYSDGLTQLTGSLSGVKTTTANLAGALNPTTQFGNFTLDAVLDLAESDNEIKILSTPSIVVSHNEEGVINVSQSRPFQTASTTFNNNNANGNATTQDQVEYRDVGIKLTATPLIGADGSVQLQIEQTIDTVQTVDDAESEDVNTRPIIGKREANSTVTVNDGDVIILGGLQENKKDTSNTYFPLVGRLPVFKQVLSGKSENYTRTELIIFIRPTVLKTPEESRELSQKAIQLIEETEAVNNFLETSTIGDTYMEGSGLIKKETKPKKEKKAGWTGRFRK